MSNSTAVSGTATNSVSCSRKQQHWLYLVKRVNVSTLSDKKNMTLTS